MNTLKIREPETLSTAEVRLLRKKVRQLQWQPENLLREVSQIALACRFRRILAGAKSFAHDGEATSELRN